jgi:ribosomal protein S18 acetylase RimI-like enzyme
MDNEIIYKAAGTASDFEQGKGLFREYVDSLGVDLSFQDFEEELMKVDVIYNTPEGSLLLALKNAQPVGCIGIRKLDEETAELKRMYVKGAFRGCGIGVKLLEQSIETAKRLGYLKMKLDTLKDMVKAQELYRSFGFYEIPSYRFNPLKGTIYMEKKL